MKAASMCSAHQHCCQARILFKYIYFIFFYGCKGNKSVIFLLEELNKTGLNGKPLFFIKLIYKCTK